MGLPRTFIGFSSTDINKYRLMLAWKANEHIDFDFANCQLQDEIRSEDEDYIKRKCRERINLAGKYILLIGEDTRYKYKYVRWEAEVALEKECTIIGVNLNGATQMEKETCPPIIRDVGAIFVPWRPKIIAYALENYKMHDDSAYFYKPEIYQKLYPGEYGGR
ncbi:MAG TPA: TIR domain-containing protein [Noviherbaspirillum sp.]